MMIGCRQSHRWLLTVVFGFLFACAAVTGRELRAASLPTGPLPVGNSVAVEFAGLHHVFRLSEKLYTGSAPEGDPGFQSLRRLGVKTILTVDGMRPDLERARKYGMRYVHLPFGYDGCPVPIANRIVRAVRDLPGPIYLHCHHGLHRSPTAAAFARITLDGLSNAAAVREMKRAGTGLNYVGLYADVRAYRPPTPAQLDQVEPDFPETAPETPLRKTMVQIDTWFNRLLKDQAAGWAPTTVAATRAGQPATRPADEALQLRELFTELNRSEPIRSRPVDFRQWLREAQQQSQELESALRSDQRDRATRALGRVAVTCGTCHAKYRDVPQIR